MKSAAVCLTLALACAPIVTGCETTPNATPATAPYAHSAALFGRPLTMADGDAVPARKVLAKPTDYIGKQLLMTGRIAAVCEEKGCWLTFGEPGVLNTIYVKFQDPETGRLIPMDAKGHDVVVEGTLVEIEMEEEQLRDLAEEAGAKPADVEKIVGPRKMLLVKGPGVKITGVAPATQPASE